MRLHLAFAVAVLLATPVWAQDEQSTKTDRFQLWNYCDSLGMLVSHVTVWKRGRMQTAEERLVITKIERSVRSRLRAARLYSDDTGIPYLRIYAIVDEGVYRLTFEYKKWVTDDASGERSLVPTWQSGAAGLYGAIDMIEDRALMSSVSQLTDKFLDKYLEVNADSCS